MPAIPLLFEGGGVRKWQSYVQVLHMISDPKVGSLPTLQYALLQKATQEEVFDVKWWRGIYCAELLDKKQHEYNNPLSSD